MEHLFLTALWKIGVRFVPYCYFYCLFILSRIPEHIKVYYFFYKNCIQIGSTGSRRFLKIRKNIIYILFFMILLKLWKVISIPIPFLQHSSYNINKFYPIRFNKISFSLRKDDADESKILSMTIYWITLMMFTLKNLKIHLVVEMLVLSGLLFFDFLVYLPRNYVII